MPQPTPVYVTPSPPPGGGYPNVGVTEPELRCAVAQGIAGYGFGPHSTVTILSRVPGDAVTHLAGTAVALDDGSFRVVVPTASLMPWCDPASGVAQPANLWELDIEVWTTSNASGNPTQAHDPHFVYANTFAGATVQKITARDAMNRVSGYLGGDPQYAGPGISATAIDIYDGGVGDRTRYLVTLDAGSGLPPDEFVVDAAVGQIVSIYRPRATSQYAPRATRDVPVEEAMQRAQAWASATFDGFDRLEFAQDMLQGGFAGILGSPEADRIYTATWRLRDPISGGWLRTGVSVRIDLDTNQELSYEAVLIGRSGPALSISADHGDCAATPYVSGLGFLPGTTVEVYGWPEGGNSVALVAEPLSVGEDGTFTAPLDLARFTGCASQTGASGFYGKHFGITAVTRRNPADALNGFADPAANAGFTVLNPEQDATPGAAP